MSMPGVIKALNGIDPDLIADADAFGTDAKAFGTAAKAFGIDAKAFGTDAKAFGRRSVPQPTGQARIVAFATAACILLIAVSAILLRGVLQKAPDVPEDPIHPAVESYPFPVGFWIAEKAGAGNTGNAGEIVLCIREDRSFSLLCAENAGEDPSCEGTCRYEESSGLLTLTAESGEVSEYRFNGRELEAINAADLSFHTRSEKMPAHLCATFLGGFWYSEGLLAGSGSTEIWFFSGDGFAARYDPVEGKAEAGEYRYDGRDLKVWLEAGEEATFLAPGIDRERMTRTGSSGEAFIREGRGSIASLAILTAGASERAAVFRASVLTAEGVRLTPADHGDPFENAGRLVTTTARSPEFRGAPGGSLLFSLYAQNGTVIYENAVVFSLPDAGTYRLRVHQTTDGGTLFLSCDLDFYLLLEVSDGAGAPEYHGFSYVVSNGCATITGYSGAGSSVRIPDVIGNARVTAIGAEAFRGSHVTDIFIPESVTKIGRAAFFGCGSLERVNSDEPGVCDLPTGVRNMGGYAFAFCTALQCVTGGNGDLQLPFMDFAWCTALDTVRLAAASVGNGSFYGCTSLQNVEFPEVRGIRDAFAGCTALSVISLPATLGYWSVSDLPALQSVVYAGDRASWENVDLPDCPDGIRAIMLKTYGYSCYSRTSLKEYGAACWRSQDFDLSLWVTGINEKEQDVAGIGSVKDHVGYFRSGAETVCFCLRVEADGIARFYRIPSLTADPNEWIKGENLLFECRYRNDGSHAIFTPTEGSDAGVLPADVKEIRLTCEKSAGVPVPRRMVLVNGVPTAYGSDGRTFAFGKTYPMQANGLYYEPIAWIDAISAMLVEDGNGQVRLLIFDFNKEVWTESDPLPGAIRLIPYANTLIQSTYALADDGYLILIQPCSFGGYAEGLYSVHVHPDGRIAFATVTVERRIGVNSGCTGEGIVFLAINSGKDPTAYYVYADGDRWLPYEGDGDLLWE